MEGRLGHISFRVPIELQGDLASFCKANSVSASDVCRDALRLYLEFKSGKAFDPQRMAIICEYTQLVADEWVKKNAPDRRDEFLATVDARLDRHHGG